MDRVHFRWNQKNSNSLAALMPLVQAAHTVQKAEDGIMVYSFATAQASAVFNEVRQSSTDSTYIAGGPHPSARTLECLEYFDYVVVGEGEETLPELVNSIHSSDPCEVKGIAYMDGGRCVYTGARPSVDLDLYPPFSPELLKGYIEITRGCPHNCGYCQTPRLFGHRMRHRSPEVVAEYAGMMRDVRFVSPNAFAYGSKGNRPEPNKIQALLEAVSKKCRMFFGTFPSEVRPEFINDETLELVKQYCHNTSLSLGAQSGSQRVLDDIGRGHTVEEVKCAVELCRDYDLTPVVDVIFGLPGETPADQHETLELVEWIITKGGNLHSHYFTPLPGTPLEDAMPSAVGKDVNRVMGRLALGGKVTGVWEPGVRSFTD
ncbi:MAG: TIGR04013 family B12-binding domain/radical SAM domain-containing protein [Methanosarcinales archaeon]|nr:TIGR04013 family B12-binding domain/radical SAM domain-containing protein [Methanosarcinales archaeon]